MSAESLFALIAFAFVASVTPGPCNLILLASGANFGLKRSLPLVLAVTVSFVAMLLAVGFGIGALLRASPTIDTVLKGLSVSYILWLAWKIASAPVAAGGVDDAGASAKPMSFLQMAAINWISPKAWAVALAVTAVYTTPDDYARSLLAMTAVFGMVNFPAVGSWATFGGLLRKLLSAPRRRRAFNIAMAVLLIAAVLPVALEVVPLGMGR